MRVVVLQTRWLGTDEWTNGIYVGKSEEEAIAHCLEDENAVWEEECRDSDTPFEPYTSLQDIQAAALDGEFFWDIQEREV